MINEYSYVKNNEALILLKKLSEQGIWLSVKPDVTKEDILKTIDKIKELKESGDL